MLYNKFKGMKGVNCPINLFLKGLFMKWSFNKQFKLKYNKKLIAKHKNIYHYLYQLEQKLPKWIIKKHY